MNMVMKITEFLFSVDQGYVYTMLSSNMINFGWELVIIETEVNSFKWYVPQEGITEVFSSGISHMWSWV